jgi:diguanylate cyclase (GGDEF)-like protein/PAS domain S-box-containing protein
VIVAKILVVDDHPTNRELITSLLHYQGHQSLEAADGAEALALVRAERPQLVICDILMPTMDGYEFVRQLRAEPAIAQTEIIFYTANYREREVRNLAGAIGVTRILIKPCAPEEILHAIDLALRQAPAAVETVKDTEFHREHLRLMTDKLAEKADELLSANLRLTALIDLNLNLASERDPYAMLEKVCHGARDLIGAKYAFLCVKDKHDGQAVYFFSDGLSPERAGRLRCPDIDHGQFGQVMSQRMPLRFSNPEGKPDGAGLPADFPDVHCGLVAPIVSLTSVYGWICLVDKLGIDQFSGEDERVLAIHAAQSGRIYENGSLYVQVERRAAELQIEVAERQRAESALKESEGRFRQISENIRDAFFLTDASSTQILYLSPAYAEIFGRSVESVYSEPRSWLDAIHPDDRDRMAELFKQQLVDGHFEYDYRIIHPDGTERHIHARGYPIYDDQGHWYRTAGVASDVTEQKIAEEKISRLNRVYAVLSGINGLIVRASDREELFRESCRIAVDAGAFKLAWIGEIDPQTLEGRVVAWAGNEHWTDERIQLTAGEGAPYNDRPACRAVRQKKTIISNDLRNDPSMAILWPELESMGHLSQACFPLMVGDSAAGVLVLRAGALDFFDADEIRLLEELAGDISFALDHLDKAEKIDYLANHHQLTGLANATLFRDRLTQYTQMAEAHQQHFALALLDVERFKTVNDALGRSAGDELLKQLAERLLGTAQGSNDLAHLAVDCFAMIFPGVTVERELARMIEERLDACFSDPFPLPGMEFKAGAKVGIALYPTDGSNADLLIRNAEAALKKAKAGGEHYLFYSARMNARVTDQLSLENKLRHALENDEFVLHYQPKIQLDNGEIGGVEALIRWNNPETGLVPPGEFIPLLEETGLILEVGMWALRQAIKDHESWQKLNLEAPRIAVNVSPVQLQKSEYVDAVRQALVGISPSAIELEITESLIMEDIETNIGKLKALRDMGLQITIDDFGTGYSSLSYLAKLPVSTLKIDRSFIVSMLEDADIMSMVSTIIALAHSLRFKVVAEGVEEKDQAKILRLLRCEEIQGYLFSNRSLLTR